jgi:hypothetical protein
MKGDHIGSAPDVECPVRLEGLLSSSSLIPLARLGLSANDKGFLFSFVK